jgi:hypothetical protein
LVHFRLSTIVKIAFFLVIAGALFRWSSPMWPRGSNSPPNQSTHVPADSDAGVQSQFVDSFEELDKASQDVEEALANVRIWKDHMAMIEGPEGDAIAADAANSKRINVLMNMDRVSPEKIAQTSVGISQFRKLLDDRMSGTTIKPLSAPEEIEFRRLTVAASKAQEQWETAASRIRAIVQAADQVESPAAVTDPKQQIVAANNDAVLEGLDGDIADIEAEKALVERALSPDVLSVLAPLIEPRNVQPRMSGKSVRFYRTLETKPMSLTALRNAGALNPSIDGLKVLASIVGDRDLPEPRWSIHSQENNWQEGDQEMLMEAQQYLREYGAVLVKAGKLSE